MRFAAALAAARTLGREIDTTRRLLRALDDRWLPRLRAELHALELDLEEHERAEDRVRRRAARGTSGRPQPLTRRDD